MGMTKDCRFWRHRLLLLVCCWPLLFLPACQLPSSRSLDSTATCPADGSASPARFTLLPLGTHPTLLYFSNTLQANGQLMGELEDHDVITGTTSVILKLPDAEITEAHLSPDGQWIVFVAGFPTGAQIRLVRLDGQAQQTLYCADSVHDGSYDSVGALQWSPDQQALAFSEVGVGAPVYLLTLKTGALRSLLSTSIQQDTIYTPVAWLDRTQLYLEGQPIDPAPQRLYRLDTRRGDSQSLSEVHEVFHLGATNPPGAPLLDCWDFALSPTATQLFLSYCNAESPLSSDLAVQSTTDGETRVIWSSPTQHIEQVRAISNTTLLFVISSQYDSSQHDIWKINSDGSGLTRLTSASPLSLLERAPLPEWSSPIWSTVSRDGSLYAFESSIPYKSYTFAYASVQGGIPHTAVTLSATFDRGDPPSELPIGIVGWTTH